MTQKTHEELKKELAVVIAGFMDILEALDPKKTPEPVAELAAPMDVVAAAPEPPKKEPSGVAQLLETVPASVLHARHYQELHRQDAYSKTLALNTSWDVAVQMDGKKVHDAGCARPDSCSDSSTAQRVRPSPWSSISCAMRRNETCVLYCRHADDGWTDELWEAACVHLCRNGVYRQFMRRFPHAGDGTGPVPWTEYWALHWDH